jgi:hypothetical protein
LILHPHLHCLVTGGGVTPDGQWRAVRNGWLLPVRVVMAVFRGKLLHAIDTALHGGKLTLPAGMHMRHWETLRHKLGRQQWHGHIRERYPQGAGVLTYLARYIRGGPISNTRLVSCESGEVTFRYRVQGEAAQSDRAARALMTLPIAEFIRRYLRHGPEPGRKVVRSDGMYAPTKGVDVAQCREQLGQGPVVQPDALDWQPACQARGDDQRERCPVCGRLLVRLGVVLPARSPPPAQVSAKVVA